MSFASLMNPDKISSFNKNAAPCQIRCYQPNKRPVFWTEEQRMDNLATRSSGLVDKSSSDSVPIQLLLRCLGTTHSHGLHLLWPSRSSRLCSQLGFPSLHSTLSFPIKKPATSSILFASLPPASALCSLYPWPVALRLILRSKASAPTQ